MNTGAFGENFPYSNFHNLNMDWIIKIAKDFLDQYTHIQEVISNGEQSLQDLTADGLEQLQTKADALEALLQEWYNTHSADIANELTRAVAEFATTAQQIASQAIATIPGDYSEFYAEALKSISPLDNTISDLDTVPINTIKFFVPTASVHPDHIPSDINYQQYCAIVTMAINSNNVAQTGSLQILYDSTGKGWIRYKLGSGWQNWNNLSNGYNIHYCIENNIPDLNGINHSCVITFVPIESAHPLNLPADAIYDRFYTIRTRITWNPAHVAIVGGTLQELMNSDGNYWIRYKKTATTWGQWNNAFRGYDIYQDTIALTDLNTVAANSVYTFVPTESTHPDHMPTTATYQEYYTIRTTVLLDANTHTPKGGTLQELVNSKGRRWLRYKTSVTDTWQDWFEEASIIIDQSGNGDFTSFTEGVISARRKGIKNIYVNEGTYNLITELNAIYPNYFTNYNPDETAHYPDNRGVAVGYGMKIVFSPRAKLVCNWETPGDSVNRSFSPLYVMNSDVELIGCNIECSNVRYAIHDDPAPNSLKMARWYHRYSQCNLKIDNSASQLGFRACIGGGFGKQSTIIVEDCTFNSVGVSDTTKIVGWHNTDVTPARSELVITGCYFVTGTCGVQYYGTTTEQSNALISNNSLKHAPIKNAETGTSTVDNVVMCAWNNEVR